MQSRHGRALVLLLLLAMAGGALSAPVKTVHVLAEPSPFKDVFVLSLAQDLPANLRVVDKPEAADVLVALGDAAFTRAMAHEKPLLGVHVSRGLSEKAAQEGHRCAAIWAGVSLANQLQLVQTMMPLARRVGVVLGADSVWPAELVRGFRGPLKLELLPVKNARDLGDALRENLNHLDAIVLPVDDALLGPDAAKLVLLTSYRQRRPVFGPDRAYVQAGSAASLYASGSDLVAETLVHLQFFHSSKRLRRSGFVHTPTVAVNEHVASSFDMVFHDIDSLREALEVTP